MGDRSETELGAKIDRCFADTLLKVSGGLAIGIVASFALFKGRSWPIYIGTGIGIGSGFSTCKFDLSSPYLLHGKKVKDGSGKEIIEVAAPNSTN
uniref:MICOS complex subunit MIC10 n=1 Tax=Rhabditophanes sp. KR3021 TaxID=114890 RepID=A0AC35TVV2_9BILA